MTNPLQIEPRSAPYLGAAPKRGKGLAEPKGYCDARPRIGLRHVHR
jgi:hypothetical protein